MNAQAGAPVWWRQRWLIVTILVYLALHLGYTVATPQFRGPDEVEHFAYVRSLVVNGELPAFDGMRDDFSARPMVIHTGLHGPLYYGLLTPLYWALQGGGDTVILYGLRLMTALLGIPLILLVYATLRRLEVDFVVARGATIGTAVLPLVPYLGSHVSNEMLAAVWTALGFYCITRALTGDERLLPWIGAGTALGLGLVTKYTAVVVVAPIIAGLFHSWRPEGKSIKPLLARASAVLLPAAALSAPWFVRNQLVYGAAAPLQYDHPVFPLGFFEALGRPDASVPLFGYVLESSFRTCFGPLWLFWRWTLLMDWLWVPQAAVALWILIGGARSRFRTGAPPPESRERALLAAAAGALALNFLGVLNTVFFKQSTMMLFAGRFLLVSAPWTVFLCVVGAAGWARLRERRFAPVALFCGIVFAQNLWIIPAVWRIYRH